MKIKAWVLGLGLFTLVGCGTRVGPAPISHGMTPSQVQQEISSRLSHWRSIDEDVTETAKAGPHMASKTYHIKLVSELSPADFILKVTPNKGTGYQVADDGLNTVYYRQGAPHYSVLTNYADTWLQMRVLGTDLPQVLKASHADSVSVKGKEVQLGLMAPVAPGITVKATLFFNLETNQPTRWEATFKGRHVVLVPTHISLNPTLTNQTFAFAPPSGVTPEVVMTKQGTQLDAAKSQVPFPILLPPSEVGLQLSSVEVQSGAHGRTLLLSYETHAGNPLIITESHTSTFRSPSGMSTVTENIGALTVHVGALPLGGEEADFVKKKTLVVVEGPTATVDSLVTAWGNTP